MFTVNSLADSVYNSLADSVLLIIINFIRNHIKRLQLMKNLEKWKLNAILISCTKDKKKQLKGVEQVSTAQNMEFSIKDFFSKCDQICSFLRIWSYLLKKSFMENFIFCAVFVFNFEYFEWEGDQVNKWLPYMYNIHAV